ncbi:MAG: hypothetical protein U5R31_12265 [Acidimicrobiia bacterium]|nr:hypothetical protein [Acidimicrobiia bacterium]
MKVPRSPGSMCSSTRGGRDGRGHAGEGRRGGDGIPVLDPVPGGHAHELEGRGGWREAEPGRRGVELLARPLGRPLRRGDVPEGVGRVVVPGVGVHEVPLVVEAVQRHVVAGLGIDGRRGVHPGHGNVAGRVAVPGTGPGAPRPPGVHAGNGSTGGVLHNDGFRQTITNSCAGAGSAMIVVTAGVGSLRETRKQQR